MVNSVSYQYYVTWGPSIPYKAFTNKTRRLAGPQDSNKSQLSSTEKGSPADVFRIQKQDQSETRV